MPAPSPPLPFRIRILTNSPHPLPPGVHQTAGFTGYMYAQAATAVHLDEKDAHHQAAGCTPDAPLTHMVDEDTHG
jgi:hypothetical protein